MVRPRRAGAGMPPGGSVFITVFVVAGIDPLQE